MTSTITDKETASQSTVLLEANRSRITLDISPCATLETHFCLPSSPPYPALTSAEHAPQHPPKSKAHLLNDSPSKWTRRPEAERVMFLWRRRGVEQVSLRAPQAPSQAPIHPTLKTSQEGRGLTLMLRLKKQRLEGK